MTKSKKYYRTEQKNGGIHVCAESAFSLTDIFECGQAFRFSRLGDTEYHGVAYGKYLRLSEMNDGMFLENTSPDDFERIWVRYFDLDRDYAAIAAAVSHDATAARAAAACPGIRILRQEPFETLISFIISQNNNIPRIKKIIGALCALCGKPISDAPPGTYAFPSAEDIIRSGERGLESIRSGFRAKYILGAAEYAASGRLDFSALSELELSEAAARLTEISGVGSKIASCVLLFGCGRLDAFPIDVWVKRILEKYYPAGFSPQDEFGEYAGIAQQYLYHFERTISRGKDSGSANI